MSSVPVTTRWIAVLSLLAIAVVLGVTVANRSEPGSDRDARTAPAASGSPAGPSSGAPSDSPDSPDSPGGPGSAAPSGSADPAGPSGAGSAPGGSSSGKAPAPYQEVTPEPAVPLDRPVDFGTGLRLRVTAVEQVEGVARGPGEVAGPAVRLRLRATNTSGEAISLDAMTVTLTYGSDRTPATGLAEPGGVPFQGDLAGGGNATAAYVFAVPLDARDRLRVTASYTGAAPTVVLAGSAT